MTENENGPDIEKIDRSEFVIDLRKRERLISEGNIQISLIRKEKERANLVNRVIKSRIKKECWDTAEVPGQSIKSFVAEASPNQRVGTCTATGHPKRQIIFCRQHG